MRYGMYDVERIKYQADACKWMQMDYRILVLGSFGSFPQLRCCWRTTNVLAIDVFSVLCDAQSLLCHCSLDWCLMFFDDTNRRHVQQLFFGPFSERFKTDRFWISLFDGILFRFGAWKHFKTFDNDFWQRLWQEATELIPFVISFHQTVQRFDVRFDTRTYFLQVTNGKNAMPAFGERLGPDDIEAISDACHPSYYFFFVKWTVMNFSIDYIMNCHLFSISVKSLCCAVSICDGMPC